MSGKVTRHSAVVFMTRWCQIKTMNHLHFIYFSITKGIFCTSAAPTHTHFGRRYLLFFWIGLGLQYTLGERGAEWKSQERTGSAIVLSACSHQPTSMIQPPSSCKQKKPTLSWLCVSFFPSTFFHPYTHATKLHNVCPKDTILHHSPEGTSWQVPGCVTCFPQHGPFLSMARCSCGYSFPPLWFHLLCFGFELHSAVISSAFWIVWTYGALFLCLLHGMYFSSLTSSLVKRIPYPWKLGTGFRSSRSLFRKTAVWIRVWALCLYNTLTVSVSSTPCEDLEHSGIAASMSLL